MLAVLQIDRIESLKPKTDSSIKLGLEAQKRGYALWYYTPDALRFENGKLQAMARPVTLSPDMENFFSAGEEALLDLHTANVLLMRQDPPFDMAYITATHLLEAISQKTVVVNDPFHVRNAPEKLFLHHFPQFVPPTLVTADKRAIAEFRAQHKNIIIKPLYGYAGHGVFLLREDDSNLDALLELFFSQSNEPLIAQKFLPEISEGDKRIILIDGKIGGAMARMPSDGNIRANFRVGGSPAETTVSKREMELCEALGPELKKRGLIFVGIDVIGGWLTEINVTSPTGIPAINMLTGKRLEADVWDAIEARRKA